tara:strand:+ start:887 stop:1621 length:735 start_codon:yes stop_codon:yes gene_type:complete
MNKTAIIIPSRLDAQRLPNKPLKLIANKEMIIHVYEAANRSEVGEVFVATPDQLIIDTIKKIGGNAILTSKNHKTGTDRVFEVFKTTLNCKPNIILNLQGDMPNINPKDIKNLVDYMGKKKCDIGTLASEFKSVDEIEDLNSVKVLVEKKMEFGMYYKALDFLRNKPDNKHQAYHHIGIYAFTNEALLRYVELKRSKQELERRLEQLRAIDNGMSIHVGYVNSLPLSVDTEKDLVNIKKLMEDE